MSRQSINEITMSKYITFAKNKMKAVEKVPVSAWKMLWKMGKEDPRRVVHGLKVGAALTLVSFLYLLVPLFLGIGDNGMWAVMTVVVVLEPTAGATLGKGLNRGLGTISAGSLAFFVEFVAEETGPIGRAVFVGSSVFLVGFMATYLRFIPYIKKNYDYGVVIFLLTFNLVTVSSYRVFEVIEIAQQRVYMIGIGCSICLLMSLLILPNWSGDNLRASSISKLDGLARSVEACVNEYFKDNSLESTDGEVEVHSDIICKGYMAVLDSKTSDENLANFASWEPRFFKKCHKYPWNLYVELGGVLRHFGYSVVSLHGCLKSEIQGPMSVRATFEKPCTQLAQEISMALRVLAVSIQNRTLFSRDTLTLNIHDALQCLLTAIKSQPKLFLSSRSTDTVLFNNYKGESEASPKQAALKKSDESNGDVANRELGASFSKLAVTSLEFSEALPFAAFAALLVDMVVRLDHVIEQVEGLGKAANFKDYSGNLDVVIGVSEREDGDIQGHSQWGE